MKSTTHVTESDIRDVIAALEGQLDSQTFDETIGLPIDALNSTSTIDECKDKMRQGVKHHLTTHDFAKEYVHSLYNVYSMDGEQMDVSAIDEMSLQMGSDVSFSEKGFGYAGTFDVKTDSGKKTSMPLIIAPSFWDMSDTVRDHISQEVELRAKGSKQHDDIGKYFVDKYGANYDASMSKDAMIDAVYGSISKQTMVMLNAISKDPMSLDWNELSPNSLTPEQKRQQAIREHREQKKEKTGLSNPVIAYSMGGAVKSPYVPEAGIRVLQYDPSLPIDAIMRNEQNNLAVAIGDVIGSEETGKEKFLVGKPVADGGKMYLPMIYSGFTSENEGEIDEAVRYLVEHTIKDSKLPDGSFVGRQGWELTDEIYRPTESQLQNAVERYTPSVGTWMGKNIDKPITLDTSLVREMENDGLQNEGNDGLG